MSLVAATWADVKGAATKFKRRQRHANQDAAMAIEDENSAASDANDKNILVPEYQKDQKKLARRADYYFAFL